jgi:hypothetical protein
MRILERGIPIQIGIEGIVIMIRKRESCDDRAY